MVVTCAACGCDFEGKNSRAKYCGSTCRSRGNRAGTSVFDVSPRPAGLLDVTRRDLQAAGRLDTVLGQQAVELAARIVSPMTTGAAVGTLSKELRLVMGQALKGGVVANPLDELRARRDRKRNAG
jgi:hypothetical protein